MKRAICLGAGLGALSAFLLFINIYFMLRISQHTLLIPAIIDTVFAVFLAFLYIRFAKGCYGKTFLFCTLFSIVVFWLLPSANSMYQAIYQTESSLGGGGGFALMMIFGVHVFVYFPVLGISCGIFAAIFNRNKVQKAEGKENNGLQSFQHE